jgi:aminopeptidase N
MDFIPPTRSSLLLFHRAFSLLLVIAMLALLLGCTQSRQQAVPPHTFTHADTLRGMLTSFRSCYDVRFYHLNVRIDPGKQSLKGSNTIRFTVVTAFDRMQVDLFKNMKIDRIVLDGEHSVPCTRDGNAVFVELRQELQKNTDHELTVYYSGKPIVAARPPWQGGFTWTQDRAGNPWVVVTCQGTGASLWWPNKDHQSDEPDSMLISISVPDGLMDISNGRLRSVMPLPDGWRRYDWFVSSPINNYDVTVNIGKYDHFSDTYVGEDTVSLDYYVMPENLARARGQFEQVKLMLEAFEHYFGPYPFSRDGYKLVECPHTGMEHQSAIAYGNRYINGYRGRTWSSAGLNFDFIIIHESAHEWWGNSVTAKDIADMWIHESFGAYAEALYVEYFYGRTASLAYINGKKADVRNTEPIIGVYNVQHEGSNDMYDKGQLVLNTLRSVIGNDSLWFSILRGLQEKFRYRTVTAEDIFGYIDTTTHTDYTRFFDQYLRFPHIPVLEVETTKKGEAVTARYRWKADVTGFAMPIKVTVARGTFALIHPTTEWQTLTLGEMLPEEFGVDQDEFYVDVKLRRSYLDPRIEDEVR